MLLKKYKVIKRDGTIDPYDRGKIIQSVKKAAKSVNETGTYRTERDINNILSSVSAIVEIKIPTKADNDAYKIQVEDIQDLIEQTLIEEDCTDIANTYIAYRNERTRAREMKSRSQE